MILQPDHLVGGLPVVVEALVAPRIVERRGRLEEHLALVVRGDLVVPGGGVVAVPVPDAGVDETVRLVFLHETVEFVGLGRADGEGNVEPDKAEVPVAGEDLRHLGLDLLLEADRVILLVGVREIPVVGPVRLAAAPGLAGLVPAAVGMVPVQVLRVV